MPRARHLPPHLPQTALLLIIGLVGAVLAEALGLPKRDVYQRALQLKANG